MAADVPPTEAPVDLAPEVATARTRYVEGVRSVLPFLLSVIPMAVVGGALGVTSGLSPLETVGLAMAANSGTAQFVAFSLLAQGAGAVTVFLTTLVLGLRMLIYSTVLRKYLIDVPRGWKVVVAFGLIDAVFFVAIDRLKNGTLNSHTHWFFIGASSVMYATWMVCTSAGALMGALIPDPQAMGLDFPMTAMFLAMLALMVDSRKIATVVAAAGMTTMAFQWLPYNLGIIVALAAGIAAGAAWDAVVRAREPRDASDLAPAPVVEPES